MCACRRADKRTCSPSPPCMLTLVIFMSSRCKAFILCIRQANKRQSVVCWSSWHRPAKQPAVFCLSPTSCRDFKDKSRPLARVLLSIQKTSHVFLSLDSKSTMSCHFFSPAAPNVDCAGVYPAIFSYFSRRRGQARPFSGFIPKSRNLCAL